MPACTSHNPLLVIAYACAAAAVQWRVAAAWLMLRHCSVHVMSAFIAWTSCELHAGCACSFAAACSQSGSRQFAVQVWQCIVKTEHWYVTELLSVNECACPVCASWLMAAACAIGLHQQLAGTLVLVGRASCCNAAALSAYGSMDAGDSSTPPPPILGYSVTC
jgi:hypothetical protein